MSDCNFHWTTEPREDGKRQAVCIKCGDRIWVACDLGTIRANCRVAEGWGDKLARWLSYVGITHARVEAVVGDCGCKERQAALNRVGWQVSDRWAAIVKCLRIWNA